MADKPVALAVSCHAFNKSGDLLALSPNTNEVIIYQTNGTDNTESWTPKWVLSEHGGQISGMDWAPESNLLVTCGHDRNAYVWKYDNAADVWKPTLVVLRINRAATSVKWSPLGNKFAVTSGAKCVPICHYEQQNDWWISKMIKKHKSTVLSVAWSPNNKFVITGSSDNKCRIFSAFIKKLDPSEEDGFGSMWPEAYHFGEMLAEFDQSNAWVHSVAWAPNSQTVAWAGHGSTLHFAALSAQPTVQTVVLNDLPFLDISFLSDNALVGVGFSCNPALFVNSGSWAFKEVLDKANKEDKKPAATGSAFSAARSMWADSTNKGLAAGANVERKETSLPTRHQNTITTIWKNKAGVITTAGVDGRVLFWDLAKLGVDVAGLKIA